MKVSVFLILIVFGFYISSCSKTTSVNSAGGPDLNYARTPETKSPLNSKDVVVFDGKNYIKKSGWQRPPLSEGKFERTQVHQMPTADGKEVGVTSTHYSFENPWLYSEDFSYEGRTLDYLKGNLESRFFMKHSLNDKVFMYSIFAKGGRVPPPSNRDSPEERFVYLIADNDGDGVFETLRDDAELRVIVPKWVLK